jgi:hypothetical protein
VHYLFSYVAKEHGITFVAHLSRYLSMYLSTKILVNFVIKYVFASDNELICIFLRFILYSEFRIYIILYSENLGSAETVKFGGYPPPSCPYLGNRVKTRGRVWLTISQQEKI